MHNWECSDTPGVFYCTHCTSARYFDRLTQRYEVVNHEG